MPGERPAAPGCRRPGALAEPALHFDLTEVDGGAGARGLRGVHLVERRVCLAQLLLRFEVTDEDGGSLCLVDTELESNRIHAGGRSVLCLDSGDDLGDSLR